jgi:cellulose synthase/poly-beta-1,6-N-acetylglucosamine synthase-like glycosyltransferase
MIADVLLVLWVATAMVATYGVWRYQHRLGRRVTIELPMATALILPVRGSTDALPDLWARLQAQDYRGWRLIATVETEADPAYAMLCRLIGEGSAVPAEIVVAGPAVDCAQKVHNQLAALARLRPEDEAIAFIDVDVQPEPDWLTRLIRPLSDPKIDAVSGYRWLMPADRHPATLLICAASQSIASLMRPRRLNSAWGGTMALRRETLARIGGPAIWRGTALDDLSLTRAIAAHGGVVLSPRELLVPTEVAYTWRDGIAFARRQYLFVRLYRPVLWLFAAVTVGLLAVGWVVALALAVRGYSAGIAALASVIALDQFRATLRRRIVRVMWGQDGLARLRPILWLDRWATPVWMGFHALIAWSTLAGRTIRWGDRVYRVDTPNSLRIIAAPKTHP